MSNKIVVVGINHAGTAVVNTILDQKKDAEVTAFDANTNISFLGCGMALWIGGQISGPDGLFYSGKEILEQKGAKVFMETRVTSLDFQKKLVTAQTASKEVFSVPYDKLILSTGSIPVKPALKGIELKNVQFVKLFQNAKDVIKKLGDPKIQNITVVGSGYIGVELAEAFKRNGKSVTLIDCEKTCLSGYYDTDFSERMADNLRAHGVHTAFGEKVIELSGKDCVQQVITDKSVYPTDLAIFCVGFLPNTKLGGEEIKRFHNGAYLTDRFQQTNIKDVYAVGDCATVYNNAIQAVDYIALATNAVRSGIIAAHNACGSKLESPGVQGSNGISIWGLNMLSTGLSLEKAKKLGYDAEATDYEDWQKASFLEKGNEKTAIRIVFDKSTRILLGAELCSKYDISMGIHLFSLAIQERMTIDKLKLLDLFFLPHFNQPYNYITMAALNAK